MEEAIKNHDFESFAKLTCADSNQIHAVCLDTSPPIFYMNDTSHRIISLVEKWNHSEGYPQLIEVVKELSKRIEVMEKKQRFALAGVELNGVIYAVGGFNGVQYLSSAERLDPREPNWRMLPTMSAGRGCHTLAVLDEKIFSIGGHDTGAKAMVATVEVYEPRMPSWVMVEPMNHTRGYHSSAVLGGSIFTFGGVKGEADTILDVVERYKEGCGWVTTGLKSIGKRCYCSAIVL